MATGNMSIQNPSGGQEALANHLYLKYSSSPFSADSLLAEEGVFYHWGDENDTIDMIFALLSFCLYGFRDRLMSK